MRLKPRLVLALASLLAVAQARGQPAPDAPPAAAAPASAEVAAPPAEAAAPPAAAPPAPLAEPSAADARCDAAYRKRKPDAPAELRKPCRQLANLLYENIGDKQRPPSVAVTLEQVKPPMPEAVGAQGSAGEVAAVPSLATTPAVGATVALAGTEAGPRLVTALGLNPGALTAETAPTYAVQSRFSDVALVFPTKLDDDDSGNSFDYVGVRVRINVLAPWSGQKAFETARAKAIEEYSALGVAQAPLFADFSSKLASAPDTEACASALEAQESAKIAAACGSPALESDIELREKKARAALGAVRDAADGSSFGLDLRLNVGDYTYSGTSEARRAVALINTLGLSHRVFASTVADIALRGRAGLAYAHLGADDELALDWGAAAELSGKSPTSKFRLSAGLEGRQGKGNVDPLLDLQFIDVKLGVLVPTGDGSNLGAGISLPASGEHGVMVTTAGDLAGFLPN